MQTVEQNFLISLSTGLPKGFTLNEILISMLLIIIGILGFSLNTMGVLRGGRTSSNITIATNLAQDKMEQLKVGTLPTCPTATTSGCFDGPLNSRGTSSPPGIHNRSWVVTVNSPDTGLSKIDVTVSWTDDSPRQIIFSTLVFNG
jgi:type II secretory pathway pseudopilin PulG